MQAEDTGENMKKKKVVIITNAPAPYRVAFFQYIFYNENRVGSYRHLTIHNI